MSADKTFESFAQGLIPSQKRLDPETLRKARAWYDKFAGAHAVKMNDRDLVEIFEGLN